MTPRVLHCRRILLPDGWARDVRLEVDADGLLTDVTRNVGDTGVEWLSGPVIPGMPNLHSHGFQVLIAGLTGRRARGEDSFWTWRQAMYDLALRIGPDELQACMGGAYLAMLRAGYTACAEFHYLHHAPDGRPYADVAELAGRVAVAAGATGLRLTLLPVFYERGGFGATGVEDHQRRFAHDLDGYLRLVEACRSLAAGSPRMRVGLAPHSLRAVPGNRLRGMLAQAAPGEPIHIHVAEQRLEVEECLASEGLRPVEWLLENLPLGPGWCLVHATHMTAQECVRAATSGAVAGLCPTTEADLGDGVFPAEDWIGAGGRFGIGSDSNLRFSAQEELRLLEHGQRLVSGRRNVLADTDRSCGRFLYESAAAGGGQALGQPVGRIGAGYGADLVELDSEHPWLRGLDGDDLLDAYVFAGDADMIRSVWVAGRRRVQAGVHEQGPALEADFARVMEACRR